jgi:hypothetical protein
MGSIGALVGFLDGDFVGFGVGSRVLHTSTYSQLPFMNDPAPKFMLQQNITLLYAGASAM